MFKTWNSGGSFGCMHGKNANVHWRTLYNNFAILVFLVRKNLASSTGSKESVNKL
jgi:hypothetical protein